jgi:hypothetical protein
MDGSSLHNSLFVIRSHLHDLHCDVWRQIARDVCNYKQKENK